MLDLAVGSYAIGVIVIAGLVLFIQTPSSLRDLETVRAVLSPAQFLLVYLVFSRTELAGRPLRTLLNLSMLASMVVSLVGIAELVNVGGIRPIITAYFPPEGAYSPWDPVYRPASTLGHYSGVGAFGTVNFTLALALLTVRHPGFSRVWLSLVMAVNLAGLVASLTWAPLIVLPLMTGVVVWHGRRVPRELAVVVVTSAVVFLLLWPNVSARSTQQGVLSSAGFGLAVPQTFAYRMHFWEEFFIPALADHALLGTGTLIPSQVPGHLMLYVDNEYLREGYRAGLLGITLLLVMQATIAVTGWRSRAAPDPTRRALGAASVALALFFVLCGLVGEYLFFAGVSQEFAMMIGLLGATRRLAAPAAVPWLRPSPTLTSKRGGGELAGAHG
jgi:hypothetical protein